LCEKALSKLSSIEEKSLFGSSNPVPNISIEQNEYGYASIATDGVWGVIDKTGKIVVEPSYKLEVYYMPKFVGKYKLEELESVYCIEIQE
jgi:hypothetical protein